MHSKRLIRMTTLSIDKPYRGVPRSGITRFQLSSWLLSFSSLRGCAPWFSASTMSVTYGYGRSSRGVMKAGTCAPAARTTQQKRLTSYFNPH
eukprot:5514062-Amphidinium_carterae.1